MLTSLDFRANGFLVKWLRVQDLMILRFTVFSVFGKSDGFCASMV